MCALVSPSRSRQLQVGFSLKSRVEAVFVAFFAGLFFKILV